MAQHNLKKRKQRIVFGQNTQEIHLLLGAEIAETIFTDTIKPLLWKSVVVLKRKLD